MSNPFGEAVESNDEKKTHEQKMASDKQKKAFNLVLCCLAALVFFVVVETVTNFIRQDNRNEALMMAIEVLKMVFPLVLGFLFGKSSN